MLAAGQPRILSLTSFPVGSPGSFPPNQPPGRVIAMSANNCDGTAALDLIGPPCGEVRHQHQLVCLQRWLGPLKVRPLQSRGGWRVLQPQTRLWRPDEPQHFQWDGAVHQHFLFITRERIERILERPYAGSGIDRWGGRDFDDRLVNQLITAMTQDCAEGSPAGPLVVDALVTALVVRLAGCTPPSVVQARLAPGRVQRVLDFIEAELHRPLNLNELATQADMGLSRFCTAFRDAMGSTPHQYLLQRRVERAKRLLDEGTRSLAEIAHSVGFSDQSQFTRIFSRMAGTTPGRYRALSSR